MTSSNPSSSPGNRLLYCIDLDGVLCAPVSFKDFAVAVPLTDNISKVNALFDAGHVIHIYTARLEVDRPITQFWLHQAGVKHDALVMGKQRADFYIDDRNGTL